MDEPSPEILKDRTFRSRSLRNSRFVACDLGDVVVRGSDIAGMDLDSPWLLEDADNTFLVNGVDVAPFVDAELNRRFPGRELRTAADPAALRAAWAALEQSWAATLERARALPDGAVDASVGGEWSFAQTLRHLVHATDVWLAKAVLGAEEPFHPAGLANDDDGTGVDAEADRPSFAEVVEVRAGRQAMVRDYLADVTEETLAQPRRNPHDPDHEETVLSSLRTILEEEWEHHRYAVRDLEALARGCVEAG